jgi:hypothetical protein
VQQSDAIENLTNFDFAQMFCSLVVVVVVVVVVVREREFE